MKSPFDHWDWQPPADWTRIATIDMHTGSGVSARAALHHAKGELRLNDKITIESILDSTMTVQAVAQTKFGPHNAVIPKVTGTAHITGRNEFWFDPQDPLRRGFIFR